MDANRLVFCFGIIALAWAIFTIRCISGEAWVARYLNGKAELPTCKQVFDWMAYNAP